MRWLVLLIVAAPAWACSCAFWPTAREAWEDSPLVFAGRVETASMGTVATEIGAMGLQKVMVRVEEAFKGTKSGETVFLQQPVNSCSPNYETGEKQLFYLQPVRNGNAYIAQGCHRSRPLSNAADDLLFLRALPASLKRSRLSGEVVLYEDSVEEGFRRQRGLVGVRVSIHGSERTVETVTNADGVYEVYGLLGGEYKVEIDTPPRMQLRFSTNIGRQLEKRGETVRFRENGNAEVSFVLNVDNEMSGRVLDPGGKPMKDVCVELEPTWTTPGRYFNVFSCSKQNGEFLLTKMPAGRYRLVANRSGRQTGSNPFPALYYPGTPEKEKAVAVTIGEGEHIDKLDIHVPSLSRRIRISGRMQFLDGTPVPAQWVKFTSADGEYIERGKTAEDGSFHLTLLASVAGEVSGEVWVDRDSASACPHFRVTLKKGAYAAQISPPPVTILGVEDQTDVVLTFPFRSCAAWKN